MLLFLFQKEQMISFLFKALIEDKPEFVDFFLEIGVPVDPYMSDGKFIVKLHKEVWVIS